MQNKDFIEFSPLLNAERITSTGSGDGFCLGKTGTTRWHGKMSTATPTDKPVSIQYQQTTLQLLIDSCRWCHSMLLWILLLNTQSVEDYQTNLKC